MLNKTDRLIEIMDETWSVPVSTVAELLEVKRPNVYKMVHSSSRLGHLTIEQGKVINKQRRFDMEEVDGLPQYVLRTVMMDPEGFVRLAMNWSNLNLDYVKQALDGEDFSMETLDQLPREHVCSIIRMLMFYLLERE